MGTRTRSLSVVKLEEMAARAAAESEAKARAEKEGRGAAVDKTLPVPPVPSGKPYGYGANRRVFVQDIFHQMGHEEEMMGGTEMDAEAEIVPRTPSLSALSLLRPPPRRGKLAFPSYGEQCNEENGLDVLERRLLEQVGTRKHPALPPPDLRTVLDIGSTSPLPPPPPVPAPVPMPGKKAKSMAREQADDVGAGATVNESAISSLALGAEEDFGGRNVKTNPNSALPNVQVEGEEEAEGEEADADGRTQRQDKGTGASSSSERGTYKARSRKSAKSDSKEKDKGKWRTRGKSREGKAKRKKKDGRLDGRDNEATRLKSAAKGRVAEWLGKLEVCEPSPEPELNISTEPDSSPSTQEPEREPAPVAAAPAASSRTVPSQSPVLESKPNPRSSGFVSVSTLRRAPISLPPETETAFASAPAPAPASSAALAPGPPCSSTAATPNTNAIPAPVPMLVRRQKYPPPQMEVKYDFKSARGGRGGRVTSVAAIWAEAAKAADSSASASASGGSGSGAATPTLSPTPMPRQANASRPAAPKAAQTKALAASNKVPIKPMTSAVVDPLSIPVHVPAKTPRHMIKQPPFAPAKEREREKEKEACRAPRAERLFGLGTAAAATPSSPALSSSIATPVLSSTASLARPPAQPAAFSNNYNKPSLPLRPAQTHHTHAPPPSQPAPAPTAAGQRPPIVNGGGFKAADLAFGQARLRDLIKRYQGQTA